MAPIGTFENATKVAAGTQKEKERERLTETALASYNVSEGKIANADELANKIKSSLGFEKDTNKSTTSKLVVQGKNTLWQIDLYSSEVEEYKELPIEFNKKYVSSNAELVFLDTMKINLTFTEETGLCNMICEITNPIVFDENQECIITCEGESIEAGMFATITEIRQGIFFSKDKKTLVSVDISDFEGLTKGEEIIAAIPNCTVIGSAKLVE